MSDTEKVENYTPDIEDTDSANLQKDVTIQDDQTVLTDNVSLSESQDFNLVDIGETEEESMEKTKDTYESNKQQEETKALEPTATDSDSISNIMDNDKPVLSSTEKHNLPDDSNEPSSEMCALSSENKMINEPSDLKSDELGSDPEDDVIQATPPESYLSPKRQTFDGDTMSLKRKALSSDEPPSKMLKTSQEEEAPKNIGKRKFEEDVSNNSLNSSHSDNDSTENAPRANVLIEETQDLIEATQQILEDPIEKVEVPKLTQVDEEEPTDTEEQCDMNKDKTLNDPTKSNESDNSKDDTNKNNSSVDNKNADIFNSSKSPVKATENENDTCISVNVSEKSTKDLHHDDVNQNLKKIDEATAVRSDNESTTDKNNPMESTENVDSTLKNADGTVQDVTTNKETEKDHVAKLSDKCKSRMSIEVLYDRSSVKDSRCKPKELVEIDEDGEKIVLDSSQEDSQTKVVNKSIFDNTNVDSVYKSCYESKSSSDISYKSIASAKESSGDSKLESRLTNGSTESKKCDTDGTFSVASDTFSNELTATVAEGENNANICKQAKTVISLSKDNDSAELLSVSDNEPEAIIIDDNIKNKSDLIHGSSLAKAPQIEREIGIYVRMKCLLHFDEGTKEFFNKELTSVQCEPMIEPSSLRPKNDDTSASLADISGNDNKDASPGSVNSNPQMFQLNTRLSLASTISSSSSASSAASLAAKLIAKEHAHFSLPRGPAKHAKKFSHDAPSVDKQSLDETFERLTKEWKNSRLLTTTILNFANSELNAADTCNISNERLDDQLQKIHSSTPETQREGNLHSVTPKSTRKGRAVKRPRSKSSKAIAQSNGETKVSPNVVISTPGGSNTVSSRKKSKIDKAEVDIKVGTPDVVHKSGMQDAFIDNLVGKEVFAKWSDNNYYPGRVVDKVKTKYKVHFCDGQNKMLIEDFIIPIPKTLREGLSVYATTKNDEYGSCGIIVDIQTINNEVYYLVETDEGEKIQVQIKYIFLSSDQAQVLKEETNSETKSLPSTPKHSSHVTLDNMIDGKRRSKRIGTPHFSTPKVRTASTPGNKSTNVEEPSVSGIPSKVKKDLLTSDNDGKSSDSSISVKDEIVLTGIQPEIIGTPNEQIIKGPQHRIKGKPRSKKKVDNEETIAILGPIPPNNSTLFKGLSFILTCASVESIDRYRIDSKDSNSDTGTENEELWGQRPFVRERLRMQIIAGGGKIYDDFNLIPHEEYESTKLIMNVPNTTAKSLLCLSVGIPAYNHNWIIRCCQQNKLVNPAEEELPAGWSLDKQSYVEMFRRPHKKPLTEVVVIIPNLAPETQFSSIWRQICENAGAVVLLADNAGTMECFGKITVVVTNHRCPSWAIEKANELKIPLLSTTWVVQCLIEGKLCLYEKQPRYRYNCIEN